MLKLVKKFFTSVLFIRQFIAASANSPISSPENMRLQIYKDSLII